MALRAFSCNPSLGGFGSENVASSAGRRRPRQEAGQEQQPVPYQDPGHVDSYGGDAFAQILKELVDNAVDACCSAATNETSCRTTSTDDDGADDTSTRTSRSLDL